MNKGKVKVAKRFEALVAANFRAAGYYVANSIENRENNQDAISEYDTVATKYHNNGEVERILIEAKSGNWGATDLFKLLGWKTYQGIEKAILVSSSSNDNIKEKANHLEKKFETHGIRIVLVENDDNDCVKIDIPETQEANEAVIKVAYQYELLEREFIKEINKSRDPQAFLDCHQAQKKTLKTINDQLFFATSLSEKLEAHYNCYEELKDIAQKSVEQSESDKEFKDVANRVRIQGGLNALSSAWYVQHRARLALLKTVFETHLLGEIPEEVRLWNNISNAFEFLSSQSNIYRLPVIWQCYSWIFGSWRDQQNEEEMKLLCNICGADENEVSATFKLVETLFPRVKLNEKIKVNDPNYAPSLWRNINMSPEFYAIGVYLREQLSIATTNRDNGYFLKEWKKTRTIK